MKVENTAPTDNLQYGLDPGGPPGASIDPRTGVFTWTPTAQQAGANYNVTVSVRAADDRRDQQTFSIAVSRPRPPFPTAKQIAIDLNSGVKLEMVLIPAGEFMMGSTSSENGHQTDEAPRHRVRITRPFYLGKYKVTQEQWQAVMGYNPSDYKGPRNPVEMVSWDDCQEFCKRLSQQRGDGHQVFRLPTEAQWEYACRAGGAKRFCFGDNEALLGQYAWRAVYDGQQHMVLARHPVGEKKPNAWGLYDMHGDVSEWCQDWFDKDYYGVSPSEDPAAQTPGPSACSAVASRSGLSSRAPRGAAAGSPPTSKTTLVSASP